MNSSNAIKELSGNPPPVSPSPFKERGKNIIREASPLFDSPLIFLSLGGGEEVLGRSFAPLKAVLLLLWVNNAGVF